MAPGIRERRERFFCDTKFHPRSPPSTEHRVGVMSTSANRKDLAAECSRINVRTSG